MKLQLKVPLILLVCLLFLSACGGSASQSNSPLFGGSPGAEGGDNSDAGVAGGTDTATDIGEGSLTPQVFSAYEICTDVEARTRINIPDEAEYSSGTPSFPVLTGAQRRSAAINAATSFVEGIRITGEVFSDPAPEKEICLSRVYTGTRKNEIVRQLNQLVIASNRVESLGLPQDIRVLAVRPGYVAIVGCVPNPGGAVINADGETVSEAVNSQLAFVYMAWAGDRYRIQRENRESGSCSGLNIFTEDRIEDLQSEVGRGTAWEFLNQSEIIQVPDWASTGALPDWAPDSP